MTDGKWVGDETGGMVNWCDCVEEVDNDDAMCVVRAMVHGSNSFGVGSSPLFSFNGFDKILPLIERLCCDSLCPSIRK